METFKITLLILSLVLVIIALVVISGVEIIGTGGSYDAYDSGSYQIENRSSSGWESKPTPMSTEALNNTLIGTESGPRWRDIPQPGTTWCDNDGCAAVGYNHLPSNTTGDYNTCICQWDYQEILDYLESISGTATWRHSFALGSDDVCKP